MADFNNLRALVVRMRDIQAEKDVVEENLKLININLDDIRLKKIPEMMDALEVKNATFEGLGRVQLAGDLYCSTKAGQKDAAIQWLQDQDLGEMITESYNASSMKALIRRLIEQGVEIPEFMNVTPFIRASLVKT